MKNILITGITGQDGIFLTSEILKNQPNHILYGITRQKHKDEFFNKLSTLSRIKHDRVKLLNIDLGNFHKVNDLINELKPESIYNLSGPSSVYDSFKNPVESKFSIKNIFDNLTNSVIKSGIYSNFYQASSSEMFGVNITTELDENSTFSPNSPYAEAKLRNHKKVLALSQKYDWNIFSGIMFNHESQFREENYLFRKVIDGAINIKNKKVKKLTLGSLDYIRDWSYAGEVSKAIYSITNRGKSNTYVIGSGKGNSIKSLVDIVFGSLNLDFNKYIEIDRTLIREGDPLCIISNPKKIKEELNWSNNLSFDELVQICLKSRLE